MKIQNITDRKSELIVLCDTIRSFIREREYHKCESLIFEAMMKYPHAPEPHNLIGLLLELQGNHTSAMKHFRAAWSLDPTYVPASYNIDHFSAFHIKGSWAIDESDCPSEPLKKNYKLKYEKNNIGHILKIPS